MVDWQGTSTRHRPAQQEQISNHLREHFTFNINSSMLFSTVSSISFFAVAAAQVHPFGGPPLGGRGGLGNRGGFPLPPLGALPILPLGAGILPPPPGFFVKRDKAVLPLAPVSGLPVAGLPVAGLPVVPVANTQLPGVPAIVKRNDKVSPLLPIAGQAGVPSDDDVLPEGAGFAKRQIGLLPPPPPPLLPIGGLPLLPRLGGAILPGGGARFGKRATAAKASTNTTTTATHVKPSLFPK